MEIILALSVLQIREINREKFGIISIFLMRGHNALFPPRNKKHFPGIILKTPTYLKLCLCERMTLSLIPFLPLKHLYTCTNVIFHFKFCTYLDHEIEKQTILGNKGVRAPDKT